MSRPEGITKKTKNNANKRPYEREQWMKRKRERRTRQVWVNGRWEKTE